MGGRKRERREIEKKKNERRKKKIKLSTKRIKFLLYYNPSIMIDKYLLMIS